MTLISKNLPPNTAWSVTLNGTTESSNTSEITFIIPAGNYTYNITSPPGYIASPDNRTITVNMNVKVSIIFKLNQTTVQNYTVTFVETDLPAGTQWTVSINNSEYVNSSTSNTITFYLPPGNYTYDVYTPNPYLSSPSSGTIVVNDSSITIYVTFYQFQDIYFLCNLITFYDLIGICVNILKIALSFLSYFSTNVLYTTKKI